MSTGSEKATTVKHRVGTCPACREYLWAEVDLDVEVEEPRLSDDGKASVYARARFLGMRVGHACIRDDSGTFATTTNPIYVAICGDGFGERICALPIHLDHPLHADAEWYWMRGIDGEVQSCGALPGLKESK